MKEVLILVCVIFCWIKPLYGQRVSIEKGSVYQSFYKAGTSKLLLNIFENPLKYKVDEPLLDLRVDDIIKLESILNEAKVKKHRQMKINVDLALVVRIEGRDHYFIISEPSSLIVDLTANLNYKLNSEILRNRTKKFLLQYL